MARAIGWQVKRAARLVLSLAALGCDAGDLYVNVDAAPECYSMPACPHLPEDPARLVHWDFNGAQWLDEGGVAPLHVAYPGGVPDRDYKQSQSVGRGDGSLAFNGWRSYHVTPDSPDFGVRRAWAVIPSGGEGLHAAHTLSASLALPEDWFARLAAAQASGTQSVSACIRPASIGEEAGGCVEMPILSLWLGDCDESRLAVRATGWGTPPELVFTRFTPGQQGSSCSVQEVARTLDASPKRWGPGVWHHIAGVFESIAERPLKVCEVEHCTSEPRAEGEATRSPALLAEPTVLLGSDSFDEVYLDGSLDDVGIYTTAKDEAGLLELVQALSASGADPDGYRWAPWSVPGTTATWSSCSVGGADGISVRIDSEDNSTGGVLAHVPPRQGTDNDWLPITEYASATLSASVLAAPAEDSDGLPRAVDGFDFVLGSEYGEESCTWHLEGSGEARERTIDLRHPSWCSCRGCECEFKVRAASIGTRWSSTQRDAELSVCGLGLTTKAEPLVSGLALGGARAVSPGTCRGLEAASAEAKAHGWCWRAISYDHDATAEIRSVEPTAIEAQLSGGDNTVARLVVDASAEGGVLDLTSCNQIEVQANLSSPALLKFLVIDSCGRTVEWAIDKQEHHGGELETYTFDITDEGGLAYGGGCPGSNLDWNQIRQLGWQKKFEDAAQEVGVTVTSLRFLGDEADCARFQPTHPTQR